MGGSATGEQVIEVNYLGTGATAQLLIDVASRHGYSVVAVGPNRFRLARTKRPPWAIVLACVTAIFALLGLLFLLIRRTESGDAVVAETRSGVTLRLTGSLSAALRGDLAKEMAGGARTTNVEGDTAPPVRPVAGVAPIAEMPGVPAAAEWLDSKPVLAPSNVPAGFAPPTAPALVDHSMPLDTVIHRLAAPVLLLSSGAALVVGDGGVIGRDPTGDPLLPSARLHAIPDPSLSKTHFTFGPSTNGVWVIDNYSTNGTFVIIDGAHEMCAPGVRTEVPFGARVVAGDLEMVVQRQ